MGGEDIQYCYAKQQDMSVKSLLPSQKQVSLPIPELELLIQPLHMVLASEDDYMVV